MFREIQRLALKSEKQNFVGVTHVTQCFYANSFNIILWSKETCVFLWSWTYLWTIKCLIPVESTLVWDVEHSLFTKLESQRNTRDVEWPIIKSNHITSLALYVVSINWSIRPMWFLPIFVSSFLPFKIPITQAYKIKVTSCNFNVMDGFSIFKGCWF